MHLVKKKIRYKRGSLTDTDVLCLNINRGPFKNRNMNIERTDTLEYPSYVVSALLKSI